MGTIVRLFNLRFFNRCPTGIRSFSGLTYRTTDVLLRQSRISSSSKRTFFAIFRKKTQKQWKIADKIPEGYPMIYRNTMSNYIFAAQLIVTTTATIACVCLIIQEDFKNMSMRYEKWSKKTKQLDNEPLILMTCLICLIVSVQMMISRLPIRIYKIPHSPKYIMFFNSIIPGATKRMICERGKIFHLEESGVLPWKNDRYLIQLPTEETRIILMEHYFRKPADLNIMLGEQNDPEMYEEVEK